MAREEVYKNQRSIDINKVYIPEAGGDGNDAMVLGKPFLGEPGSVCSLTYIVLGYDPDKHNYTKQQCESILSYVKTRFVRYLISLKKKTQHGDKEVYQFVPIQDWSKLWTDEELYLKYKLSKDEIDYIESIIKPMGEDALFDADAYIDPEFADFDLNECGVKTGDRIVYTPTGAVLTVKGPHEVEYEDEMYTLAQFTAKFMPRNKRSVSGVCQGPKYFTKGGTSLYKMKESFLGGKK
jgi:hypothetical protein